MKFPLTIAALLFGALWVAGPSLGQTVSQSQVVDEAGTGDYPVTIVGSDGQTYRCRADLVLLEGKRVRYCVNAARTGLAPNTGAGVAAALALGAIAVAASDDS